MSREWGADGDSSFDISIKSEPPREPEKAEFEVDHPLEPTVTSLHFQFFIPTTPVNKNKEGIITSNRKM